MNYDLSHLTQDDTQAVSGPIQDDEALLLFSVCRVVQARRVAEFGTLHGYSAKNFLAAVGEDGIVWSVDPSPPESLAPNHRIVRKRAAELTPWDFNGQRLDLLFFDCHDFGEQFWAWHMLRLAGLVDDRTILALHDTGTHPQRSPGGWPAAEGGFAHALTERSLANVFADEGYACLHLHCPNPRPPLVYRHGLTLCLPNRKL